MTNFNQRNLREHYDWLKTVLFESSPAIGHFVSQNKFQPIRLAWVQSPIFWPIFADANILKNKWIKIYHIKDIGCPLLTSFLTKERKNKKRRKNDQTGTQAKSDLFNARVTVTDFAKCRSVFKKIYCPCIVWRVSFKKNSIYLTTKLTVNGATDAVFLIYTAKFHVSGCVCLTK